MYQRGHLETSILSYKVMDDISVFILDKKIEWCGEATYQYVFSRGILVGIPLR